MKRFYPAIRLAVACLVLAIGLRTWLVMGLIEPVTVAGSSMAPTLRGIFVAAQCPKCHHAFSVGAEFAARTEAVTCPQCARSNVPLAALAWQHGDRIWIDRTTLRWRAPQRWEVVVARNPEDAAELCVKRVAGLPGETLALRDGNVLVDGAIFVKSLDQQHLLRQLVHREISNSHRWQPAETTHWRWNGSDWQHEVWRPNLQRSNPQRPNPQRPNPQRRSMQQDDAIDWLRYQHPRAKPLTDDVTYNAGLTRQLNLVDEFMLSAELMVKGEGTLGLALNDGTARATVTLQLPGGELTLSESGQRGSTTQLAMASRQRLALGKVLLEFSNFDGQLLLTIDGRVELRRPWPITKAAGTDSPVSIGVQGMEVWLDELKLYRDTYHCTRAVDSRPPLIGGWLLGAEDYFLLGDNSPISLDSRRWGPVPRRLLVGRLLGEPSAGR